MNFVYWIRGEEYAAMAERSAASVKRCYPSARVLVYTDGAYPSLENTVIDDVLMVPAFNDTPPMVANLQAQVHYCLSDNFTAPTVFLDADVIAVQPMGYPSKDEYWKDRDLVVTQRDHVKVENGEKIIGVAREMPYNYGVLMVNNNTAGREAMIWLRDRVARFGSSRQQWYGNQWALRELVGGSYQDTMPRQVERNIGFWNVRVQVLECDKFNYTPESADESFKDKYFLHPKGDRREIFEALAEKYA